MPVSEKKRQSNLEWDRENMRSLTCRVRTYEAEDFKKWCELHHTNTAAVLKKYVFKCLEEYYKEMEKIERG